MCGNGVKTSIGLLRSQGSCVAGLGAHTLLRPCGCLFVSILGLSMSFPTTGFVAWLAVSNEAQQDRMEPGAWMNADKSRLNVVKYLLANGADINAKNKDGKTPLTLA